MNRSLAIVMTDAEIAIRVRLLAKDSGNPLSVTCWVCNQSSGDPCVVSTGYFGWSMPDEFHPLRRIDATRGAENAMLELLRSIAGRE